MTTLDAPETKAHRSRTVTSLRETDRRTRRLTVLWQRSKCLGLSNRIIEITNALEPWLFVLISCVAPFPGFESARGARRMRNFECSRREPAVTVVARDYVFKFEVLHRKLVKILCVCYGLREEKPPSRVGWKSARNEDVVGRARRAAPRPRALPRAPAAAVRMGRALAVVGCAVLCLLATTAGTDLDVVEAAYYGQAGVMARALVLPERSARAPGPAPGGGSGKKHKSWALENEVPLPEFPPPSLETIRAHFATPNGTVIVAQTAATATLPCIVKKPNLGAITWTRKTDYHLLTVGLTTYTVDQRFIVEHVRHQQAWNLQIRQATEADAGLYECQITSHPPVSVFLTLKVIEARAEVVGAPDLHIKAGSSLRLVCRLQGSTETPAFLFWYRGTSMVNYDAHDGISVVTGEGVEEVAGLGAGQGAYSVLRLDRASPRHAGNYTCVPANARPASIQVHVINDEAPAAMQRGSGGRMVPQGPLVPLWAVLLAAPLLL